jgi:hypothetical protein
MPETIADVLVRLGVDTSGLRAGFRDARSQTLRFLETFTSPLSGAGGGFFGAIGSLFTGLFTRGAKNAAKSISREFQNIITAFNTGSANLGETIRQLETERANAIQRLSGKKGGRKELNKLLPQFDEALATLRTEQQQFSSVSTSNWTCSAPAKPFATWPPTSAKRCGNSAPTWTPAAIWPRPMNFSR